MKRSIIFKLAFLALVLIFIEQGALATADSNNNCENAPTRILGNYYPATLNSSDDWNDYVAYTVSSQGTLKITVDNNLSTSVPIEYYVYQGGCTVSNFIDNGTVPVTEGYVDYIETMNCPLSPIIILFTYGGSSPGDHDYNFTVTYSSTGGDCSGENEPPTITMTAPTSSIGVLPGDFVYFAWNGNDSNDEALVVVALDDDQNWDNGIYEWLFYNRPEDGSMNWEVPDLPEGTYYLVAQINDSEYEDYDYADGAIVIGSSGGGEGTEIPEATITSDVIWGIDESPYIVTGKVYIQSGASLTIESGVYVDFGSAHIELGVFVLQGGTLNADGVTFDGTQVASANTWAAIEVQEGSALSLTNCDFSSHWTAPSSGGEDWRGTHITGNNAESIEIDNCTFNGMASGISLGRQSHMNVSNSVFTYCNTGIGIQYGTANINGCTFDDIYSNCISLSGGPQYVGALATISACRFENSPNANGIRGSNDASAEISNCCFSDLNYAIYNGSSEQFVAENNWWNSETGPDHPDNPNGTGEMVVGDVDYKPYITDGCGGVIINGYAELQITDFRTSPSPPTADGYTKLYFTIENIGNLEFVEKELEFTIEIVDLAGVGDYDSFLLGKTGNAAQIRQNCKPFEKSIPALLPGETITISTKFKFKVPDYSDRLDVTVTSITNTMPVDDINHSLYRSFPIIVDFGSEAGANCYEELILATKLSPLGKIGIPQALECTKGLLHYGQDIGEIPMDIDNLNTDYDLLVEGFRDGDIEKIVDGGKYTADEFFHLYNSLQRVSNLAAGILNLPQGCVEENSTPEPIEIIIDLLAAAWNELVSFRGCGAWAAHHILELKSYIKGNLESFSDPKYSSNVWHDYDPSWIIVACPVDLSMYNGQGLSNNCSNGVVSVNIPESRMYSIADSITIAIYKGNSNYVTHIIPTRAASISIYYGQSEMAATPNPDDIRDGYTIYGSIENFEVSLGDTVVLISSPSQYTGLKMIHKVNGYENLIGWDSTYYSISTLDTGSIAGTVIHDSEGLLGIPINLSDNQGNIILSATSDESGNYQFAGIPNGEYYVECNIPLGFQPATESIIPIAIKGLPEEVNFELTNSSTGKVRGYAWWKNQLQTLVDGEIPFSGITEDSINQYCQNVYDHFYNRSDGHAIQIENVSHKANAPLAFGDLTEIFLGECDNSLPVRIEKQLLAAMLNVASNRLSQLTEASEDGATVSQAITFFAGQYSEGEYSNWYQVSKLNYGRLIPVGVIPLGIPNVIFKDELETSDNPNLPTTFALHQNYPNPFNPETQISFALPERADVKLEIYNIMGQKVATVAEGSYEAGIHTVTWDGSKSASGVYFYKLTAGDYKQTRKMLLLK